jgi:hypothetical protein
MKRHDYWLLGTPAGIYKQALLLNCNHQSIIHFLSIYLFIPIQILGLFVTISRENNLSRLRVSGVALGSSTLVPREKMCFLLDKEIFSSICMAM